MFLTGCDGGDCNRDHDHHESCLIYSGLVGTEGTELQTSVVAGAPDETKRRTHDCISPMIEDAGIRKPTIMVDPLRPPSALWRPPPRSSMSLQEEGRNSAPFSPPSDILEAETAEMALAPHKSAMRSSGRRWETSAMGQ